MTNGVLYCNQCGVQNSPLANFCANCGAPFAAATPTPPTAIDTPEISRHPPSPAWQPATPTAPTVRYGGFWIRFVAIVIDGLLVQVVVLPVLAVVGAVVGVAGAVVSMPGIGINLVTKVAGIVFSLLANWIYEAAFESSAKQATLGKMALGLKVTDLEGRRISFARATGRHFSKLLSTVLLLFGYIMAGFTARKQALHDMIAGTVVVRTA